MKTTGPVSRNAVWKAVGSAMFSSEMSLLTWLSALAALKLAARGFRRGMLQYQHRIRFKEILKGKSHA